MGKGGRGYTHARKGTMGCEVQVGTAICSLHHRPTRYIGFHPSVVS